MLALFYEQMLINRSDNMSRPIKCRRIAYLPDVTYFKPAGIPMRELEEVNLSFEEAEAIRLKDLEGLEQEPAADKMNISRPTFQRILASARRKIADVLLNGKAIRIEGGNFEVAPIRFKCMNGHEWAVSPEILMSNPPPKCPVCSIPEISMVSEANTVSVQPGRCCRREAGWPKCHRSYEDRSRVLKIEDGDKLPQTREAD
jgi:predicted DNA-binding protein (UPF0251 family)